jgi:hypothetical protein
VGGKEREREREREREEEEGLGRGIGGEERGKKIRGNSERGERKKVSKEGKKERNKTKWMEDGMDGGWTKRDAPG